MKHHTISQEPRVSAEYKRQLVNAIESVRGWVITWDCGMVVLSADNDARLSELVTFLRI